jgi:hypothetical protein
VVPLLVVGRGGELRDADVPRVERRHQPFDRAALAGGVPPLEDDAQRRAELARTGLPAERQPLPQQLLLRGGQALLGLLPREGLRQVDLVQPRHGLI